MADSSRDSTTTLHEEPEGIALDSVFRSASTIPGYNLVDPRVQSSSTTQAMCLDINNPEKTNETLDESSLLQKLETIDFTLATAPAEKPQFFLITSMGDPSVECNFLEISPNSLEKLYHTLRFRNDYSSFYTTRLFHCSYHSHYDIDADPSGPPTSIIIVFRCPRNSRCISCIMRVQLADRSSVIFLCGPNPHDLDEMRTLCIQKSDLLRVHPLYFLTLISDQRYPLWASSFAGLWLEVVVAETATGMNRPDWMTTVLKQQIPDRIQALSDTDILLYQLHATNTELCQCDTVMSFAVKYGNFCLQAFDVVESSRERRGHLPLPVRYKSDLKDKIGFYIEMYEGVRSKLSEVKERIRGQINVSISLIAQRDSKTNLENSRSMKTIAVMTLAFLPLTLVNSIWSANLFHLDNATNWKLFVGLSVALTIIVFSCWWLYIYISRRRRDARLPRLVKDLEFELSDVGSVQNLV